MNTFNGVDNLGLVYSTVPLVDPKTGVISRPWWQFFVNLYHRVGGPNAPSNDQLAAMIGNNAYFMLSEDMNQEDPFSVPFVASSNVPLIQTPIFVAINFNEETQEDVASTALSVMNFNAQNAQTLQNATWAAPLAIGSGTPNSGAFTSLSATTPIPIASGGTGNASGTATINANLTGPITSVGNATSVASQTGTGTKFVMDSLPTLASTIGVGGATASNSGAGVTFPATASPSSNVNTLDDYEEGTWTPTDASGAGLAVTSNGYYTKIGNLVTVQAYVGFPVTVDGSAVKIGGFPFTSANGTNQYSSAVCLTGANVIANLLIDGAGTAFQLRSMTNSTFQNLIFSGSFIIFTASYMT